MADINDQLRKSISDRAISSTQGNPNQKSSTTFQNSNLNALKDSLAYNRYTFSGPVDTYLQFDPIHRYNASNGSYQDYINDLENETDEMDIAGTILNGQGIGWDGSGLVSNFDTRNSIAGRVLSATGVINDTPLGKIGNRELLKIMANRTLFNTQSETLGRINLNPIDLLQGGSLIRPDYSITIGRDFKGKLAEVVGDLTGVNLPIKQLKEDSSIFQRGNANNLIKNTGKGQIQALFSQLKENKYGPAYTDDRIKKIDLKDQFTYDSGITSDTGKLERGQDSYDKVTYSEHNLLGKTKAIMNDLEYTSTKYKYPKFINGKQMLAESDFTQNTVMGMMSMGSGVKSSEGLNGDIENVFGRVFTKDAPYNRVNDLQKHRGLDYQDATKDSVLDSNGFIRIAPKIGDDKTLYGMNNMKNFMLSLENLAWDGDDFVLLPESEKGPGDPVNGTRGRIMWFPPYDVSFTDTTSMNWESTNFVGRGEPVYTYNNTERSGNLQFRLIIDYPSYIEDIKGTASDDLFNSLASGTESIDYARMKNLSVEETRNLEVGTHVSTQTYMDAGETPPDSFTLYYGHNSIDIFDETENPKNRFFFGTPGAPDEFEFRDNLNDVLSNVCPSCKVVVKTTMGDDEEPMVGLFRAKNLIERLEDDILVSSVSVSLDTQPVAYGGCVGEEYPVDSECKQEGRKAIVSFVYDPTKNEKNISNEVPTVNTASNRTLNNEIKKRFINEALYFEKMALEDPITYNTLSEKIKFFHPAFHSMTPEGFNSRLNFLQQCTRQGSTQNENRPSNLAFGKPPVCILRVGDFYHTKIIMDTLNLSFEPLMWDINPEGSGVQPMICTVDIGFKFLGGSSLKGPITKLQNAVSFNFFANTGVYDERADQIVNGEYVSKAPKVKPDENVSQEEVNENKLIDEPFTTDELARLKEGVTEEKKGATIDDFMSNLIVEITGFGSDANGNDEVRYVITKREGFTTEITTPIRMLISSQIYDPVTEDDTYIANQEYQLGHIELSEDKIGVELLINIHKNQYDGVNTDCVLTLTFEAMKLKISNTYTFK